MSFGNNNAKINGKAEGRMSRVAKQLKGRGPGSVKIAGYTDDLGCAAHGKTLSKRRATAVADLLGPHMHSTPIARRRARGGLGRHLPPARLSASIRGTQRLRTTLRALVSPARANVS